MDSKELAHGLSEYAVTSRLGPERSTLPADFSPRVSKRPQLPSRAGSLTLLLICRVCAFLAAWFGLSILALLVLLHFKDARKRHIEKTNSSRSIKSTYASMVPPMRISRTGAPTLLSSNQPRQRKPSLNRTQVSSFSAPTPPPIPVPPPLPSFWAAPLVPDPPKNLSRSDTTRSLPTGDTNRDGILVVYSSISTRPASDLLSHEDLRPRSQYAVLAITNQELEHTTLAPADRSLDGCLVGPVQPCGASTSIDLLAGPIVEEPVTPPAVGVASYHSTGDLTIEYLEDKPHSAGTRGLLLAYDDSSSTAFAAPAGSNVRDTQSAVGVEFPLRSAFASPVSNLDGRRTLRRSRTLSAVRFVEPPPPVNDRTTRTEGFAAATCGELGDDTASPHAVGANVEGPKKVPYRSQSWDFSQDDSAEIQRKFLKHTNQHMRKMLSREQL